MSPFRAPARVLGGDVRVVLVRPEEGGNVGAACRAAMTMGIDSLYLVNADGLDLRVARILAVHATNVLDGAVRCTTVEEAVAGCVLAAAVTRRDGKRRKYRVWTPEQLGAHVADRRGGPIALVFGNERNGLTDAELSPCHVAVSIPSSPAFPSLNLSHAVQVVCYEVFKHATRARRARPRQVPVTGERITQLTQPLTDALRRVRFFSGSGAASVLRFLSDILARADLVDREAQRLERIIENVGGLIAGRAGRSGHASRTDEREATPEVGVTGDDANGSGRAAATHAAGDAGLSHGGSPGAAGADVAPGRAPGTDGYGDGQRDRSARS